MLFFPPSSNVAFQSEREKKTKDGGKTVAGVNLKWEERITSYLYVTRKRKKCAHGQMGKERGGEIEERKIEKKQKRKISFSRWG